MPEKYTIKITTQAQEQLRENIDYISYTLQAPATAMKMLDTLEKEIASLDRLPNRVPLTEEEPWRSQGIHKLPVKNYLVYFWVDEKAKKVQVISIIYGRRDQRHRLSGLDMNWQIRFGHRAWGVFFFAFGRPLTLWQLFQIVTQLHQSTAVFLQFDEPTR